MILFSKMHIQFCRWSALSVLIMVAFFTPSFIPSVLQADAPVDTVRIDLASQLGPPTYRASGFIYGLSQDGTEPPQDMQSQIRTRFIRAGGAQIGCPNGGWVNDKYAERWDSIKGYYARSKVIGATFILLVHDVWGADAVCNVPFWPGDSSDWKNYTDFMTQLIGDAVANGMTGSDVQWDIWNEPDLDIFWGRDESQYLEMWKRGYEMIRAGIPNAKIVGPSMAGQPSLGNLWFTEYLDYIKANNVVPDYMSWHQLVTYSDPQISRTILNDLLSKRAITIMGYQVNEYGDCCNNEQQPGPSVWYIGRFERNNVDALRANWGMNTGLYAGMGGLVTSDGQPLGPWWAYKRYADITGQLVSVKAGSKVDGVAGTDSDTHRAIILLGNRGVTGSVTLQINGFDSATYLLNNGQVNVLIEQIPSGTDPVTKLPVVSSQVLAVTNNTLTLTVNWTNSLDAYSITLTPDSGT